ncbi:MAG: HlyD family type I secretion periplasmic adaptor subunit [Xanthobacteraceae bacterium]|nr:MAG: HlyD family type I secretion periplasmic adaptor subunit [Xanthobacteraceae bacterium]
MNDRAAGGMRQWLARRAAALRRVRARLPAMPSAARTRLTHAFQTAHMGADNRAFLPAAIEILETPPSPIATRLTWFICAAALATLAWSYFGWIDIHAIAPGKIQPSGRSKVVQPVDAGRIAGIFIRNGGTVKAGDTLVELDATETTAEREAQAVELEATLAEAARRRVAIRAARNIEAAPSPVPFPATTSDAIRAREQAVLAADLGELSSLRASLVAQLAERAATKERLTASIAAREKLIALSRERVGMRETLSEQGSGSRALVIEALQQLETQMTTDAGERGQLLETEAAMRSLGQRIAELGSRFIADQTQKLADAERRVDRLSQDLIKARSKYERTQIRAPIDGTVQQLAVTTVGQVVTGGQSLMTIVPLDGPIEVEALIFNKDIGFVEAGQPATVKVEAFPFTRYGTIAATVANVSRDGVDPKDISTLGDAASVTRPQGTGGASGTPSLVFPATLTLAQRIMMIDGKPVPLIPGMAVTVEIKTGQRRIIDYLMSPISAVTSQAARER